MTKHELREEVFRIIFGMDFHEGEDINDIIDKYIRDTCEYDLADRDRKAISGRAAEIAARIGELDARINRKAEGGWTTNRMGRAELNILRIALYEILYDDKIPFKVSVNEAVELSKVYCGEDAPSFVNGFLSHFSEEGPQGESGDKQGTES